MPIINEYLVSLGAIVNSQSFKKAQGGVIKNIKSIADKWDKYQDALAKGDNETAKKLLSNMSDIEKKYGAAFSKMSQTVGNLQLAFEPLLITLGLTKDALEAIYDISSKVSNEFVTMKSLFVDKDVRDLMAITGVGTIEAQAIKSAEELTGMNIQELPYATPEQQKMFTEFIETYMEGLRGMNQADLQQFNDVTQEFQKTIAESKLQLQLSFMKMIIATGPQLESLFESLTTTMDNFVKIVDSSAFQIAAKLFVATIKGIVDVLTAPVNITSGIIDFFKGNTGSQNNNTNYNVEINSNAEFQGNPSENVNVAREYSKNNALNIAENFRSSVVG